MSSSALAHPTLWFRERAGVWPNALALLWSSLGWLGSFALLGAPQVGLNLLGVLLCAHCMLLAAYLVHEAAHQSIFASSGANAAAGEWLSFIAGSSYASFERIRHLHMRHHVDRADLACFNFKRLVERRPWLRRLIEGAEWAYLPAAEILMHLQVIWRPLFDPGQRRYLARALCMLVLRGALLSALAIWSVRALLLYALSYALLLHVLNFFDAFHHTFDQYFVEADEPLRRPRPDRAFEQANTYSNLASQRWPWLNLLTLNFGYHNAHHERASAPWYRLPRLHAELYGAESRAILPVRELLRTWHRNRVRRVCAEGYGAPANGATRADQFIGAHGVSFLTVV